MPQGDGKRSFYLLTLGCPKNTADSEELSGLLISQGLKEAEDPEGADILLLNTCGFIEDARKESIDEIFRLIRLKGKTRQLIVFGCLAQRYRDELMREIPEIDLLFGVNEEERILQEVSGNGSLPTPDPVSQPGRSSAYRYLKIADGCNRGCSFCAIPSIKGPFSSLPPEKLLVKARRFISSGAREIILVAQETTSYEWDTGKYRLEDLVRDITRIGGNFRVRLHYFSPYAVRDELLEEMARNPKVCKYVDIPLQHSEEGVLRLMRRGGNRDFFRGLIGKIRKIVPGVTLRSTFIVGFPGETERDFEGLLDFVEEMGFDRLGAFLYSREEDTPAWPLGDPVPIEVKEKRYHELISLQERISLRKNLALSGKRLKVLVDETDGGDAIGRHEGQSPEIDGVTLIRKAGGIRPGEFIYTIITGGNEYDLEGVPA
jgi:ribosomal protein S12 methylthiotransferase